MKAIILAAGKGTRLKPLTETSPKPLLRIANKPILEYNLNALRDLVDEVLIIVGYKKEKIMEYFGNSYKDIKITYVIQKEICGTGNAVLQAEPFVKDEFIVMNGDDIFFKEDIKKCLKYKYSLLAMELNTIRRFGAIETRNGCLKKIVEKPKNPKTNLANIGLYKVNDSIFSILKKLRKSERNEYEIVDAITELAKKQKVKIVKANNWISIGYPWHLIEANEFFLKNIKDEKKGNIEKGVIIKGNLKCGKGTKILSGVYIEGNVIIGENCKIGPNCYIRGSTSIGDNCHIGQAVEIKNSIIGDNTNVAHLSYVGDSVIGNNVNFGAGTIVANLRHDNKNIKSTIKGKLIDTERRKLGTIIGDNVHTGINTSIYPGRIIHSGKITLPGEIVKKEVK